jgi:hypothetical protein
MTMSKGVAKRAEKIVTEISPLLHGHEPTLVGAVLGDLTAMLIAGHFVAESKVETDKLREELLQRHIQLVRELIPINEKQILENLQSH